MLRNRQRPDSGRPRCSAPHRRVLVVCGVHLLGERELHRSRSTNPTLPPTALAAKAGSASINISASVATITISFFITSSPILGLLQLGNRRVKYAAPYQPNCLFLRDFSAGTEPPSRPRKARSQEPFPGWPNPRHPRPLNSP